MSTQREQRAVFRKVTAGLGGEGALLCPGGDDKRGEQSPFVAFIKTACEAAGFQFKVSADVTMC